MGPKTPYDTEKLPPGIITIISAIFGAIFFVGLIELLLYFPSRDSTEVLGATSYSNTNLEVFFITLIIILSITTIFCIRLFRSKKR